MYGATGKGAVGAGWKQAARAEPAAANKAVHAQGLHDLVQAYERIPHHV